MQAGLRHDTPPDTAEKRGPAPTRRCIASGAERPRGELLRFVVDPQDRLVPDIAGRLPGRGIWLSPDRDSFKTARDRKLFQRAARRPLIIEADLDARVEHMLADRCIELVGLARRAGQAVAGFEKVAAGLRQGRAVLVLEAQDGAEDGRRKLHGLAPDVPVADQLRADELGRAFGRERTVHAMLASGALATKLLTETRRLAGFRHNRRNGDWND